MHNLINEIHCDYNIYCFFKSIIYIYKRALLFSEEKISCVSCKDKNKEILVKLLWQIFKFFKY